MILCRNCNVNIPDDAIYCPYCGCIIRSTPNNGNFYNQTTNRMISRTQKNDESLLKLIAFFLILIVIAFLVVINVKMDSSYKNFRTPKPYDLTLEKVIELSEKGQGLSWSDFDNFVCEEERYNKITGEQSRKYKSHFTYTFSILISGQRGSRPEKILLMPKIGGYNNNVDLRNTEEVKKFIEKNKSGLIWQ